MVGVCVLRVYKVECLFVFYFLFKYFVIFLIENMYCVYVYIGDVFNVGINFNVFICLYGEFGDFGEWKLDKFEIYMDKFERNNVRFVIRVCL